MQNVTLRRVCGTIVAVESYRYSIIWACVFSLRNTPYTAHTHIAICALSGSTIFFHIITWTALISKKKLLNIWCVFQFSLQLLSETFFILSGTQRDMIKIVSWSSCKEPVKLVRFFWYLNFLYRLSKNAQLLTFMKIRPMGAEVFHENTRTDGQTYDESSSRFSQLCERV